MMLVFDHVCVFYGDTPVLRELSFQVRSGEQVGLIGANGAGKSTLMKAALGLLPYTGSITVDGIPVTRKTLPEVRRKLGYVLQDADNQMFMPTVLDDMVFGPMNYGLSRAAAEQRAEETLAALHMEYLRDRHNHKMSGGEKRMAAVATILAMQQLGDMFRGFQDDFGGTFLIGLMTSLFTFLWSLLFVIPGIVKMYAYSMAYYIKLDHPDYGWKACIDESRQLMDGHKWEKFVLDLSFLGWIIVGSLCLGVGTLWVTPYMEATNAQFYEYVRCCPRMEQ